ncbi:MAG: hypothetical protein C4297_02580 [Gemmataceae bacterium]
MVRVTRMTRLFQAAEVIGRAETEIRQLLLDCAREGAYEEVALLADLARQLRRLVEHAASPNGPPIDPANPGALANASAQPRSRSHRTAPTGKPPSADYPRFFRSRDELVKIGWSKKRKAEYRHKAPSAVVRLVARALQARGTGGEQFTFEELLPIRDPQTKSEVPSYQAYLALAWLRKENLVVQHGRQGYSLRPDINLADAVEERWKLLPGE